MVSLRIEPNKFERNSAQERNAARPLEEAARDAFITAIDRSDGGGCHARTDSLKARPAFQIRQYPPNLASSDGVTRGAQMTSGVSCDGTGPPANTCPCEFADTCAEMNRRDCITGGLREWFSSAPV